MDTLKLKKAWEVAIAPAKQLPMNAIGKTFPTHNIQEAKGGLKISALDHNDRT